MNRLRTSATYGTLVLLPVEALSLLFIAAFGHEQTVTTILSVVFGTLAVVAFVDLFKEHAASSPRRVTSRSTRIAPRPRPVAGSAAHLAGTSRRGAPRPRPRAPWEMPSVIVSQASTVPYFVLPLWAEWFSVHHDALDISICILASIGLIVALSIVIAAVYTRPDAAQRHAWVAFLALLPLASSVQFWYTTIYQPSHDRPNVNIQASLTGTSTNAGVTRVTANITLSNDGAAIVDFFDAAYTITSFDMKSLEKIIKSDGVKIEPKVSWSDASSSYVGTLQLGRLIRPGGHLVPGQTLQTSFVFQVRNVDADKVRLTVFLSTIADTGTPLSTPSPCRPAPVDAMTCGDVPVPLKGRVSSNLLDHPVARTEVDWPVQGVPVPSMKTTFTYADSVTRPKLDTYGILNSRRFTTSIEYSLAK